MGPGSGGVIYTPDISKEELWDKYYTDAPKRRRQLTNHLHSFVNAYNFAKHLKSLKGLTPYEFIVKQWQKDPEKFIINPIHYTPKPYI